MKNLLLNSARSIVPALLAAMFSLTLSAQDMALNRLELNDSISDTYSFLVTGHIYGDSHNKSGLPAASISANIDRLQMDGVEFLLLIRCSESNQRPSLHIWCLKESLGHQG